MKVWMRALLAPWSAAAERAMSLSLARDSEQTVESLIALAIWKLGRLLSGPFRYRANCDLEASGDIEVVANRSGTATRDELAAISIEPFISRSFNAGGPVDLYWAPKDLYRKKEDKAAPVSGDAEDVGDDESEDGAE